HLESKGDDTLRTCQITETLEDARQYEGGTPTILAGDFNFDASGGSTSSAISQAQFQDAFADQHVPTTPHSFLEPGRDVDWIFIRRPIPATSPTVHSSIFASHHYPFTVVLALRLSPK